MSLTKDLFALYKCKCARAKAEGWKSEEGTSRADNVFTQVRGPLEGSGVRIRQRIY